MKRRFFAILVLTLVFVLTPMVGFSQSTVTITEYTDALTGFAEDFAPSLPMNAAIGLNWSDAYIGQFLSVPPHFGVGVTAGLTTIPLDGIDTLFEALDLGTEASAIIEFGSGVPLPGFAVDARIGGFVLPFDAGLKFGKLAETEIGGATVEYSLIGLDARYAILNGGLVMPKLSVGAGYNRLSGSIGTASGTIPDIPITSISGFGDITLTDPALAFDWEANVFDVKAQLSKSFLIIEPSIGIGYSFGKAATNAGLNSNVEVAGFTVTASELTALQALGLDVSADGFTVGTEASVSSMRVFGGASLNILILKIDLGGMYNIASGAVGFSMGARVQL